MKSQSSAESLPSFKSCCTNNTNSSTHILHTPFFFRINVSNLPHSFFNLDSNNHGLDSLFDNLDFLSLFLPDSPKIWEIRHQKIKVTLFNKQKTLLRELYKSRFSEHDFYQFVYASYCVSKSIAEPIKNTKCTDSINSFSSFQSISRKNSHLIGDDVISHDSYNQSSLNPNSDQHSQIDISLMKDPSTGQKLEIEHDETKKNQHPKSPISSTQEIQSPSIVPIHADKFYGADNSLISMMSNEPKNRISSNEARYIDSPNTVNRSHNENIGPENNSQMNQSTYATDLIHDQSDDQSDDHQDDSDESFETSILDTSHSSSLPNPVYPIYLAQSESPILYESFDSFPDTSSLPTQPNPPPLKSAAHTSSIRRLSLSISRKLSHGSLLFKKKHLIEDDSLLKKQNSMYLRGDLDSSLIPTPLEEMGPLPIELEESYGNPLQRKKKTLSLQKVSSFIKSRLISKVSSSPNLSFSPLASDFSKKRRLSLIPLDIEQSAENLNQRAILAKISNIEFSVDTKEERTKTIADILSGTIEIPHDILQTSYFWSQSKDIPKWKRLNPGEHPDSSMLLLLLLYYSKSFFKILIPFYCDTIFLMNATDFNDLKTWYCYLGIYQTFIRFAENSVSFSEYPRPAKIKLIFHTFKSFQIDSTDLRQFSQQLSEQLLDCLIEECLQVLNPLIPEH